MEKLVCEYEFKQWCPDDVTASDNVVAWMPLPEPYKEDLMNLKSGVKKTPSIRINN